MKIQKIRLFSKSLYLFFIALIYSINLSAQTFSNVANANGNASFNAWSTNGDSQFNGISNTGISSVNLKAAGSKANIIKFENLSGTIWNLAGPDASNSFTFNHYNGSSWSIPLSLSTNGFVGIGGITTPRGYLHFPSGNLNRKIILHEGTNNDHNFFGFGISSSTLRYQVNLPGDAHVFYAGKTDGSGSTELMRITGVGSLLGSGAYTGTTGSAPASGAGTRMMWIPAKAAFRAGTVSGTKWDDGSIGNYSAAFGLDNQASGNYSFAVGGNNTTSSLYSFAAGANNNVTSNYSSALGYNNTIAGSYGFASGNNNSINSGSNSIAMGYNNIIAGSYSVAIGLNTSVNASSAFVLGTGNGAGSPLKNETTNSLMIGFNDPIPAFFVKGGGANAAVGIATTNIPSTAVAPTSAGYKLVVGGHSYLNGSVVIGNQSVITQGPQFPSGYSLYVTEGILARKIKVALPSTSAWSDYVFDEKYKLMPLDSVATYVKENKHLPNIPSAEEAKNNGVDLLEMDAKLLQKVEELTLYMIEQKKELEKLKEENKELNKKVEKLSKKRKYGK